MSRKALGRGLSALFPETRAAEQDLLHIQLDLLDPNENQPRTSFSQSTLEELASSIKSRGIIQPLVVRKNRDRFQIVAGERRWRAAQLAGLQKVPCIVKDIPPDNVLEVSLIENIQREELNPIEEANAYRRLLDELGITQDEIAKRVGKDRSSITNSLRLLKLPNEIQQLVQDQKLSMGHARALLSITEPGRQKSLAAEIVEKALSVRECENLVKRAVATPPARQKSALDGERANVLAAEAKLSRKLATPVRIKTSQTGGVIEIRFSSPEELTRLFDLMIRIPTQN
jgi:ParB family chromosome partitioning protein